MSQRLTCARLIISWLSRVPSELNRVWQRNVEIGLIMTRCIDRRRWRIIVFLTGDRFVIFTPAAKKLLSSSYNLALSS